MSWILVIELLEPEPHSLNPGILTLNPPPFRDLKNKTSAPQSLSTPHTYMQCHGRSSPSSLYLPNPQIPGPTLTMTSFLAMVLLEPEPHVLNPGILTLKPPNPPPNPRTDLVGSKGRRGRWGTPTMALRICNTISGVD